MGQTTSQVSSVATAPPATPPHPHPPHGSSGSPPAGCPMHQNSSGKPADCPVSGGVNPLNQMPELSQNPAAHQSIALPTERTESSIPRSPSPEGETPSRWEYPSPQQFYNALVRKGWETPEEHIETMVQIHNFLNEEAWNEVLKWEARNNEGDATAPPPQLARFQGRPGELSPKARFFLLAGWLLPSRFNTEPPFDRHDWVVRRPTTGEEVRYVIDYYSAPPEPDGSPVFSLDVRPALDSFGSVKQRIFAATEDAWSSLRSESA